MENNIDWRHHPDSPKCEDIGFKHLWVEKIRPAVFVGPRSEFEYIAKERKCRNCDKEQQLIVEQERIEEWEDI